MQISIAKGSAYIYFGGPFGNEDALKEFQSKKVETIRVWTSDSFVERDFSKQNSNDFIHMVNCLTK